MLKTCHQNVEPIQQPTEVSRLSDFFEYIFF